MSNREQNRQFRDAVRELERILGRQLTDVEWDRLHREVSGMEFSFGTIIQVGWQCLGRLDMKATAVDIRQYFQPVFGTRPWRVKRGVGSFLTFEFGPRIRAHGFVHGQWHLWVYLANWRLFHGKRELVDSDADRKLIEISIRRLKETALTDIDFDPRTRATTFFFDDFRLVVSPADYLEDPDERDDFWKLFVPNNEVLTVGRAGVRVVQADAVKHV